MPDTASSMLTVPKTACVGSPEGDVRGAIAHKQERGTLEGLGGAEPISNEDLLMLDCDKPDFVDNSSDDDGTHKRQHVLLSPQLTPLQRVHQRLGPLSVSGIRTLVKSGISKCNRSTGPVSNYNVAFFIKGT